MASEQQIANGVLMIAACRPDGVATFSRCRRVMPGLVPLDADNLAPSEKRPGEPMWHQIVRNIKSHEIAGTNYISEGWLEHVPRIGFRITEAGRAHVKALVGASGKSVKALAAEVGCADLPLFTRWPGGQTN